MKKLVSKVKSTYSRENINKEVKHYYKGLPKNVRAELKHYSKGLPGRRKPLPHNDADWQSGYLSPRPESRASLQDPEVETSIPWQVPLERELQHQQVSLSTSFPVGHGPGLSDDGERAANLSIGSSSPANPLFSTSRDDAMSDEEWARVFNSLYVEVNSTNDNVALHAFEHDVGMRSRNKGKRRDDGNYVFFKNLCSAQQQSYYAGLPSSLDHESTNQPLGSWNPVFDGHMPNLAVDERAQQQLADHFFATRLEFSEHAVEEGSSRLRECTACAESKPPLDFPAKAPTTTCTHQANTCTSCLKIWIASEFSTKGTTAIKCPECPETLSYHNIQSFASQRIFLAYDKLLIGHALSAEEEFQWCLAANCGSGQLNIDNNEYMKCASCGYEQCSTHKVAWHVGETCRQYEYRTSGQMSREQEAATEWMIDSVSKRCPGRNCGWRIQKIDGCDHMTCKKCSHQFCWQCLASQKEIRRRGNTAHGRSCPFHSNNLGVSFPFNAH